MGAFIQLGFGCLFGMALTSTGAADFDAMERMFRFEEAHLFGLSLATTLVAGLGLFLLLRSRFGTGVRLTSRTVQRGSISGALLFGLGWGLSGTCPGTILAQLGSGHAVALFTLVGILLGNWLFERFGKRFAPPVDSC